MKLSGGERLILTMLADIQKHLQIRGNIDADLVLASVQGDRAWGLKQEYQMLLEDVASDEPAEVKETFAILLMYDFLGSSYQQLSVADRQKVDDADHSFLHFQGFDGNHDPHQGVMHYIVRDLGRFTRYNADLTAVRPLGKYRRMLEALERVPMSRRPHMTADEVIAIASA